MKRFEFLRFLSAAIVTVALSATAQAGPLEPGGGTDNVLLVAGFNRDAVRRYDGQTGAFVDTFVPKDSGGMNQPWAVLFGPHDHNLYVSTGEFGGPGQLKGVLRYDGTAGAFIDEFAHGGDLRSPEGSFSGRTGTSMLPTAICPPAMRGGSPAMTARPARTWATSSRLAVAVLAFPHN
jgi:hypothetical protein